MQGEGQKIVEFCFSAPAKFILSGEHSVVYGKDALVATIDMRTRVDSQVAFSHNVKPSYFAEVNLVQLKNNFQIAFQGISDIISKQSYEWDTIQDFYQKFKDIVHQTIPNFSENDLTTDQRIHFFYSFAHIFKYIVDLRKDLLLLIPNFIEFLKYTSVKLVIESELPIAKGVGSSASFAVTIASSILKFWEKTLNEYLPKDIASVDFTNFEEFRSHTNNLAFDFEKIFHSTPSGLDNSAISYGGILAYNRVEQRRAQIEVNFLDTFEIVLIDSGMEKNTKKTVEMIRKMSQNENTSQATISIINTIGDITKSIEKLLSQKPTTPEEVLEAQKSFEQLIKMNHCLLKSLNLTNPTIDKIIQICERFSFSSKLTGGGDGGYCVCFIPKTVSQDQVTEFLAALSKEGFETTKLRFAKQGLILENMK